MTRRREALSDRRSGTNVVAATWRLLILAAVLVAGAGARQATAQTVVATNAPRGSTFEVVLNATPVGSAVVDLDGIATVALDQAAAVEGEMDAFVFVDVCGERRRVLIVQAGLQVAPREPDCIRREITGLFVLRPNSTVVLNMAGAIPRLFLIQGPFDPTAPPPVRMLAPTGLVLFGGTGLSSLRDAGVRACGNVGNCTADGSGLAFSVGAVYWFIPFLGAEAGYVKPAEMTAEGGGETYRFDSSLDAELVTFAGVVGVPVGPLRIYGKAGTNYHRALFSTTQTIDDRTLIIDEDETEVVRGGTQTLQFRGEGWGWQFGGGVEGWLSRHFAIYGEFGWTALRGTDPEGGEGITDDRKIRLVVGARLRIGR
jgi:hypothetical protein